MQNRKTLLILKLSCFLIISSIVSCQKEALETAKSTEESAVSVSKATSSFKEKIGVVEEQVDLELLQKYVDYKLALEKAALIEKSGAASAKDIIPKMHKEEIQKMVDNFLANERNVMRHDAVKNRNGQALDKMRLSNDTLPPPANPFVSCAGTIDASTSGVIFAASYSSTGGSLASFSFGFTGISGTMTPIGGLSQSYYNGVITYQQIYSDTYIFSGTNVTYTQAYIIYGNVYNGGCTVHGMKYLPN